MTLLYVLLLLFSLPKDCDYTYWDSFTETQKEQVLEDSTLPRIVFDYYNDALIVSDDQLTIDLLEIVSSCPQRKDFQALYFYELIRICKSADGSLAEVLGSYCIRYVIHNADYAFYFFYNNPPIMHLFADLIGYEYGVSEDGTKELAAFKRQLNKTANKYKCGVFFNLIQSSKEQVMN